MWFDPFISCLTMILKLTLYLSEVLFINSRYPHRTAVKTKQKKIKTNWSLLLSHARYPHFSLETLSLAPL